jgi:crotonobetainyl-CoA:carnitine CoA-transferase CaiB-like acyl-CoA transferase
MTKAQACQALTGAGIAAGPCQADAEAVADQHVAARACWSRSRAPTASGSRVLVPGHPELPECDRADHKGKT